MAVAHARSGSYRIPPEEPANQSRPAVLAVIGSNLFRRPARTALTAIGIAIGVATIVALLSVTLGLKKSAGDLIHLGDADIGIFQRASPTPPRRSCPTSSATSSSGPTGCRRPPRCCW